MSKKPKVSKCPSCGADIYWTIDTSKGSRVPVDVAAIAGGNVLLAHAPDGTIKSSVLKKGEDPGVAKTRLNHFATCSNPPPKKEKGLHKGGSAG